MVMEHTVAVVRQEGRDIRLLLQRPGPYAADQALARMAAVVGQRVYLANPFAEPNLAVLISAVMTLDTRSTETLSARQRWDPEFTECRRMISIVSPTVGSLKTRTMFPARFR
jgi:hypothetical protein